VILHKTQPSNPMRNDQIKTLFDQIAVWKKGGQRAPHKPLLILYALSLCLQKKDRLIPYTEIDEKLRQLLVEFGPTRKSYHPEYPFWRLQNDGVWELANADRVALRKGNSDAKKSELTKNHISGGFKAEIFDHFYRNPGLVANIATSILEEHFPSSVHEDILQAIGMDLSHLLMRRQRDSQFRDKVLRAYEYQCAVCGFNVRLGNTLIALEAAHIKWHQAGGPDSENNGIALCTLHHKLFDRGAFTLSKDLAVQVSDRANGTAGFSEWLLDFHGKDIKPPQRPAYYPKQIYVDWHVREVFQGEARHIPHRRSV
jgi:putative restriction endonuclease